MRDLRIVNAAALGQLAEVLALGEPLVGAIFERMEAGEISDAAINVEVPGSGPHHSPNIAHGLAITYALRGRVAESHRFFAHADRRFDALGQSPVYLSDNVLIDLQLLHVPFEADHSGDRQRLVERPAPPGFARGTPCRRD